MFDVYVFSSFRLTIAPSERLKKIMDRLTLSMTIFHNLFPTSISYNSYGDVLGDALAKSSDFPHFLTLIDNAWTNENYGALRLFSPSTAIIWCALFKELITDRSCTLT